MIREDGIVFESDVFMGVLRIGCDNEGDFIVRIEDEWAGFQPDEMCDVIDAMREFVLAHMPPEGAEDETEEE